MKYKIEFDEFLKIQEKLEIKPGFIQEVLEVPKSKKLLHLLVNFGNGELLTVVTNIKSELISQGFNWDFLKGKVELFVTNLVPVTIMGIESQAMILPQYVNGDMHFGVPLVGYSII